MHKQYPAWARLPISTVRMCRWKLLQRPHPSQQAVCNGDVLALLERCYRTTDRYDKEQTSPLASLEARWLAPFERVALSRQSFDNASLAVAMARGIKATLCAHGPTVLTNPEPCSAARS